MVQTLSVLGHRLGLHHGPLVTLTLQDALLTLVLLDLGNLALAVVGLIATVALRRARPLTLTTATLCRIMPLLHDLSLRDIVSLMCLELHLVVLFKLISEGFFMLVTFAIQEQTVFRVDKLALLDGTGPLLSFKRVDASRTTGAR